MTKLEVLHFPDPRLRKKASPVEAVNSEIKGIAEDMLETMYDEGGIGLAAIQVNIQKRIIVIDVSEDRNQPRVLINPTILSSEGTEQSLEARHPFLGRGRRVRGSCRG